MIKKYKPTQFRLGMEDNARIEAIKAAYGLATNAAAVRFVLKMVADKLPCQKGIKP